MGGYYGTGIVYDPYATDTYSDVYAPGVDTYALNVGTQGTVTMPTYGAAPGGYSYGLPYLNGTRPDGTAEQYYSVAPFPIGIDTRGWYTDYGDTYGAAPAAPAPAATTPAATDTYGGESGGYGSDTYVAYDEATGTYYKKSKSKSSGSSSDGYSSSGGYASGGGSSSGGGGVDTYNGVPLAFPFADGFGNPEGDPTPVYANGTVHPFFGGSMPGGGSDTYGGSSAKQVTVPSTGASAGPYGVTPPSSGGSYGGGGGAPAAGGGSGGGNDFYWNIRNNILGKFGGSDSGGSYPSEADYRRAQNQADQRYKQDQKQAQREQERQTQFYSIYNNPTWALPTGMPQYQPGTTGYDTLASLPTSQLAMMTSGYQGKDRYTAKPQRFERTLADLYKDIDAGTANFQLNDLMGNLFSAGNKSSLGRMFMEQKPSEAVYNKDGLYKRTDEGKWKNASASSQASTMMSMLNAAYNTTLSPLMASAYSARAQDALDAYGAANWDRKNPQSILNYMGNYLGY